MSSLLRLFRRQSSRKPKVRMDGIRSLETQNHGAGAQGGEGGLGERPRDEGPVLDRDAWHRTFLVFVGEDTLPQSTETGLRMPSTGIAGSGGGDAARAAEAASPAPNMVSHAELVRRWARSRRATRPNREPPP